MAINSREKGSGNERAVAKLFSDWAGEQFNRVPASGGLRWKADNNVTGDIVAPAHLNFPFSIECKKVECDWDVDQIIGATSEIWKFWSQCCEDARRLYDQGITKTAKEPLLIFTKNRRKQWVMLRYFAFTKLPSYITPLAHVEQGGETGSNVVILPLDAFLEQLTLKDVKHITGKIGLHQV